MTDLNERDPVLMGLLVEPAFPDILLLEDLVDVHLLAGCLLLGRSDEGCLILLRLLLELHFALLRILLLLLDQVGVHFLQERLQVPHLDVAHLVRQEKQVLLAEELYSHHRERLFLVRQRQRCVGLRQHDLLFELGLQDPDEVEVAE
jgi:hypothetical protein